MAGPTGRRADGDGISRGGHMAVVRRECCSEAYSITLCLRLHRKRWGLVVGRIHPWIPGRLPHPLSESRAKTAVRADAAGAMTDVSDPGNGRESNGGIATGKRRRRFCGAGGSRAQDTVLACWCYQTCRPSVCPRSARDPDRVGETPQPGELPFSARVIRPPRKSSTSR